MVRVPDTDEFDTRKVRHHDVADDFESVATPRHHALRFEFENQAAFPAFPQASQQALRVTFRITTQDIQAVPGRHEWRNTVRARLIDVCPLAQ